MVEKRKAVLVTLILFISSPVLAGPGYVGNGDGGADLEGATPITDGPIVAARAKAAELLRKLNTQGVPGLGLLLPEVESSPLYLARGDRRPDSQGDQGTFHSDMRGRVFARTFAHPHAATRFFPVAMELSEDQLIALHVHEALHRSLPASIAEDEARVTTLTLAITSPSASFDQIEAVAAHEIPNLVPVVAASAGVVTSAGESTAEVPQDLSSRIDANTLTPERRHLPITLHYTYSVLEGQANPTFYSSNYSYGYGPPSGPASGASSLQKLEADTKPFSDRIPLTIGLGLGFVTSSVGSGLGPAQLSAQLQMLDDQPLGGVGVTAWARSSFPLFSGTAFTQSGFSRNVTSVGLDLAYGPEGLVWRNSLYATTGGDAATALLYGTQSGNPEAVRMNFSASFHDRFSVTREYEHFRIGAFAEAAFGDSYLYVEDPTSTAIYADGRHLVPIPSLGPMLAWEESHYAFSVDGRFILPLSGEDSFDVFGDLWNEGSGSAMLTAKFSLYF